MDRLAEALPNICTKWFERNLGICDKNHSNEELIREKYQGIRPAPGYPACPDHTEKGSLFDLEDVSAIGVRLQNITCYLRLVRRPS